MKGIVFTEFLDMVEAQFSLAAADEIIESANLPSGGAYTAIGTYNYAEMVVLVSNLSEYTGIPIADLLRVFGRHLFRRLVQGHQQFVRGKENLFDFLCSLEEHIHVEVRKLYSQAELPQFSIVAHGRHELELVYTSARPFADFAHGLLLGSIDYYGEEIEIKREDLAYVPDQQPDGRAARFVLTRRGAP